VGRAVTILFVDDDPYIRKVLCTHLHRAGFEVLSAADGQDALEVARHAKGSIDLLISDVMMPGMTGPELARSLVLCRADLKVLLISASPDFKPPADPGWEFLRKPFPTAALLEKVRQMLPEEPPMPVAELLRHRMREARAEYVRYSQEYDLLMALTGDLAEANPDRARALRQAAEVRQSTLRAYSEAVRQFSDFLRIGQMPDSPPANAAT
jgi:CheY-like chemotaxis protein